MNDAGRMTTFRVRLRADAEMLVEVEAKNAAEALRLAREGDGEPQSDWEPRDYQKVRAVGAKEVE